MGTGASAQTPPTMEVLKEVWDEFDLDKDGKLTLEELTSVLTAKSEEVEEDQCEWLFKLIDTDKKEAIDFDQFVTFFYPPSARSPLAQDEKDVRLSLADLVRDLGAPMVLVSAPEMGARKPLSAKKYDAPVMTALEQLPDYIDANFLFAVDFAGSTTSQFANSRIRNVLPDGRVMTGADDFSETDYSSAYKGHPAQDPLPTCSEHFRQQVENSFWINLWRGQVHGALISSLNLGKKLIHEAHEGGECPILEPAGFEGNDGENSFRVTLAISIDGGAITQVEKAHLPTIFRGVLSNVRRRGGSAFSQSVILWCHFPTVEDFLQSLGGKRNLSFDEAAAHSFTSLRITERGRTSFGMKELSMRDGVVPATFQCVVEEGDDAPNSEVSMFRGGCDAAEMMKIGENAEQISRLKMVKCWTAQDEDGVLFILEKHPGFAKIRINDEGEQFPMVPAADADDDGEVEGSSLMEKVVQFGMPKVFKKLVELGVEVDKEALLRQLDAATARTMVSMSAVLGEEEVAVESGEPPKREILRGQLVLKQVLKAS